MAKLMEVSVHQVLGPVKLLVGNRAPCAVGGDGQRDVEYAGMKKELKVDEICTTRVRRVARVLV